MRTPRMLRAGRAYVADTATVAAVVTLEEDANLWYGVMVRGDDAPITIGARTNIQDNAVVHVDPDAPNRIGADCTIGHGALIHGVEVGDMVLVGMGAILLGGSRIGDGCVIGAGAVVLENTVIPPYSLAVGAPARIVRQLDPEERRRSALAHSAHYVRQAQLHADGRWDGHVSS